jgi:predicted acylesterase/phospholipase RssA
VTRARDAETIHQALDGPIAGDRQAAAGQRTGVVGFAVLPSLPATLAPSTSLTREAERRLSMIADGTRPDRVGGIASPAASGPSDARLGQPAGVGQPIQWWREASLVADVAGVFEGGGAKGLAFAGALRALRRRERWFRAVAGASAGAITAALIAAGADPDQLETWTHDGLQTLASQLAAPQRRLARARFSWRALHHLASPTTAAIATSDDLGTWLRKCFATLRGNEAVTFGELFEATEIELTVVAVDLIGRKHRIFCHTWTPDIPVADAVIASSSIPFALPATRLSMEADPRYGTPVVDGGVWTNFPTFVFHDEQFRAHHGLPPIGDQHVIGFLLDEDGDTPYDEACDRPHAFGRIPPRLSADPVDGDLRPAELLLSYDDAVIDDAIDRTGFLHQGRIAAEASDLTDVIGDTTRVSGFRTTKRLPPSDKPVDVLKRLHDGQRPWLAHLLQGLGLLANPYVTVALLAGTCVGSIGLLTAVVDRRPDSIGWAVAWGLGLATTIVVVVSALALSVFLLLAHAATHWPIRRYGILLTATYAAGSGAPYWTGRTVPGGRDDGVIRLPIPPELTTLSFAATQELRADVVRRADDTTTERLASILRDVDPLAGPTTTGDRPTEHTSVTQPPQ